MKILETAIELFVLYLLYKLIFDFIIPLVKTTQQVKKQFGDMSAKMQEKMNEQQQQATNFKATAKETKPPGKKDDYIDFEEVK